MKTSVKVLSKGQSRQQNKEGETESHYFVLDPLPELVNVLRYGGRG